jgi:hypothetical protein
MELYVYSNISEEHSVSIFTIEDGGSMFIRNIGTYLPASSHEVSTQKADIDISIIVRTSNII